MNAEQQGLLDRITLTPSVLGGRPSIRGMRFLVSDVLELLSTGMAEANLLTSSNIEIIELE